MEVKNIAVIEAGIMGYAMAEVASTSGLQVFLQDVFEIILGKALGRHAKKRGRNGQEGHHKNG